jgi:hypothetical protein
MITCGAQHSLACAFLLGALHRFVGGLLRHAEMLADLPPVGAGLERLLHVLLPRRARGHQLDHVGDDLALRLAPDQGALVRLGERRTLARDRLSMSDW